MRGARPRRDGSSLEQSQNFRQLHDRSIRADEGLAGRGIADHIKPRRARRTSARAAVLDRDDRLRAGSAEAASRFAIGFGVGLARRRRLRG